jgi:RNA polymerase sigma factor (sigma-70 family)
LTRHEDAFTSFFRDHYGSLAGALTLYCGDRDLAEEAAQETMVRAFVHWSDVTRVSSPQAWLFRVGRNFLASYFRRLRLSRRAGTRAPTHDGPQLDDDDRLWLRDFVSILPARQRTVLIMRFYLDSTVAETAQELGWPEGTVKTLTRAAVKNLRRMTQPEGEE